MPEMLGPDDLVLHAGTLRRASVTEKCAAAVAGRFAAITLYPEDVVRVRAAGLGENGFVFRECLVDGSG